MEEGGTITLQSHKCKRRSNAKHNAKSRTCPKREEAQTPGTNESLGKVDVPYSVARPHVESDPQWASGSVTEAPGMARW